MYTTSVITSPSYLLSRIGSPITELQLADVVLDALTQLDFRQRVRVPLG